MNETQQMALAYEIADALEDRKNINMHIKFAKKYDKEYLTERLADILSLDKSQIDTTRAAYYVWLVKTGRRLRN